MDLKTIFPFNLKPMIELFITNLVFLIAARHLKGLFMEQKFWGNEVIALLKEINVNLNRIERRLRPVGVPDSVRLYYLKPNGQKERLTMLPLAQGKVAAIEVEILDAAGNPAKVQDDKLEWGLSDDTMGVLEVNGMSALFKPTGKVGLVKVFCKADADLGEGVKEIVGEGDIEVLSGEAILLNLKISAQDPA